MRHLILTLGADLSRPRVPRQHDKIAFEVREFGGHINLSRYDICRSPHEFKAQAQEDRLQILKTLEAQAALDAVVS